MDFENSKTLVLDFSRDVSGSAIAFARILNPLPKDLLVDIVVYPNSFMASQVQVLNRAYYEFPIPRIPDFWKSGKRLQAVRNFILYQKFLFLF